MTDRHTDEHAVDEHAVDEHVAALFDAGLASQAPHLDAAEQESLRTTRRHLRGAMAAESNRHRRRRWALPSLAAGVACALLVAAALWPDDHAAHHGTGLPGITASASAAEVLDAARTLLLESGSTAGSGTVWHGVSRSYHDGDLVSINEQWFDSASERNLLAAWGRDRTPEDHAWKPGETPADGGVRRDVLLVDRVDDDGWQRLRRFERPAGEDWTFPPGDLDPTRAMDLPPHEADRQRQLADAMRAWLAVASDPDATESDLQAATRTFQQSVPDYFSPQPEGRSMQALRAAVPARQVAYLLTTVQASPEAVGALYELFGGLDSLERLDDVHVNGRLAYRLRFDPSDPSITPTRERVLVLDAETGRIIRTESIDRRSWTEVEPATRVAKVGDDAELCTAPANVDCGLLRGKGGVAELADRFEHDMEVRYAVHAQNRALKQRLGDDAPPTMCLKMTEYGACDPQDAEEARRIDAIAANEDAMRAVFRSDNATPALGDDTAFSTNVPLSIVPDTDGIWRSQGQCFRDWRVLSICRG